MRIRGHTARILGNILVALGAILVVAGITAAAIGMLWVKDATTANRPPPGDAGEAVQALVLGGLTAAGLGILGLVLGLVLRGVGKALNERAKRLDAAPAPAPDASKPA